MRRLFAVVAVLAALFVPALSPLSAGAQVDLFKEACQGEAAKSPTCVDAQKSQDGSNNSIYGKDGVLTKVVNLLSIVIGIAAVIMIVVGGAMYVLAGGDSAKINTAKNTIIYSLIGLVVAVVAPMIIRFVIRGVL